MQKRAMRRMKMPMTWVSAKTLLVINLHRFLVFLSSRNRGFLVDNRKVKKTKAFWAVQNHHKVEILHSMKSIRGKKDEDTENLCFVCKDGGDLRLCDDRHCLKSFHNYCVGKDVSFLDSEDRWTCDWHFCFNCRKSSHLHCYTCTKAVCRSCLHESDLLKVKGKYGFCDECLELALLIEEKKDVSSNGVKVDFTDRDTYEGLFVEYYATIKENEGFASRDISVALDKVKKKNKRKFRSHSEEFNHEHEKQMSDNGDGDVADEKRRKKKSKEKINEKKKTIPKSSFQMEYMDRGSKSLMESIVNKHVQENKHIDVEKKKEIQCDEELKTCFKRTTINKSESHGDANISSESKRQKKVAVEEKYEKVESDVGECRFAAVNEQNLKLVYLKRSVVYELLKEPDLFEEKVIGCFVRAKPDPNNCSSRGPFQLMQVKGVKRISAENNEVVFLFSSVPNEIAISLLSDGDFSKEECEALRQKVITGQIERPTVVDLQKKAEVIHEEITKHRINKELALLQIKIDQANEKGWRRELSEHRDRKKDLQSPVEQSKLLANVPSVIPDTSELESNAGDVKKGMRSDVCFPTSILQCHKTVPGTSGMAEQNARLKKILAKKTKKNASARISIGTGNSSGIPRPTRGGKGPFSHPRDSNFNAGPSTAAGISNPIPLRHVEADTRGVSKRAAPTVHISDESSDHESAQLERRRKFRHDPINLMDLQTQTGGPSHSSVSSIDIVQQYEAYFLRDRLQQQGDEERPEFQSDQAALVPDWRVYPNSSVLGATGAKVASEVARHVMLLADKAQLITMPHTCLEDTIHKTLAESSLAAHSLSLNISYLKHENAEVRKSYDEYRGRLNSALVEIEEARKFKAEAQAVIQEKERLARRLTDLEQAYNDLKSDSLGKEDEIEVMKKDLVASKTELEATKAELVTVKAEAAKNYEAGMIDGRGAFITSPDYRRALDESRFNGARDFRHSTTFQMLALEPAADFIFDGFIKAVDYMVKDGHVVPGFDPVAFEQFASADALRPSSANSSVEYVDFPEFRSLGPVDSDEEETGVPSPEGDEAPVPTKD